MRTIVTGSIAYDYLMAFPGRFHEHLIPDKMTEISVSFLVDSLRRLHGGTAPNIAYNLALLGERPVLVGAVGQDFAEYAEALRSHGVDLAGVEPFPDDFTASCFTNTDQRGNQITAFYPGAMARGTTEPFVRVVADARPGDDLVIVAPNDPRLMQAYVGECQRRGLRYLYDPSMQAPRLDPADLDAGFRGAALLTGNNYEFGMMAAKLGVREDELHRRVPVTVVTRGEEGALIIVAAAADRTTGAAEQEHAIPAARPTRVADPTGAGDAFRAGLIAGMARGFSWPVAGRMGAVAAVYAVEQPGTQTHRYTPAEFVARYEENFGPSEEVRTLAR